MITLTPAQEADIIAGAKSGLVQRLLTEKRDDLELLTPVQVCGLLNINQKTLDSLKDGPPRVTLVPGAVIRYRASEVAAYIDRRTDS